MNTYLPYLEPKILRAAVAGDPFWSAGLDAVLAADPAPRAAPPETSSDAHRGRLARLRGVLVA
ncbi:MAG: hypothetical protein ACPL8I_12145 [Chloroflexaceae bacterium]